MSTLRIATRKSPLALWQAEHVKDRLEKHHEGLRCELMPMSTSGDRFLNANLTEIGGKSMFVKELEGAIMDGSADIAVHSMKDVTAALPDGLEIAVYLEREDPRDALVGRAGGAKLTGTEALAQGARIGTASSRRQCQLLAVRPDLHVGLVRGNVNTRLRKLDAGEFDALVLAASGLIRLAMSARISAAIAPEAMLPAIGQGVMGIECRSDADAVKECISVLNDASAQTCVLAERAMNAALGGGCTAPLAGFATLEGGGLRLRGLVGRMDGAETLRADAHGALTAPSALGQAVAEELLGKGARALLDL
jgi:hydroxymethylbilane synthase